MLSARTVSSASKSPALMHALAIQTLEAPPTPRIRQTSTLCRMFSNDGDLSNVGPGNGLTMHDVLPHRALYDNAITKLRSGVGLGIDFNSRDLGTLAPPPTPLLSSSATLSEAGTRRSNQDTIEGKALNALTSSKLFMRRRHTEKPMAPISTPSSSIVPAMASLTLNKLPSKTARSLSVNAPLSPAMSAIHAYSTSSPTAAGTFVPVAKNDEEEPIGLGITISGPNDDAGDKDVIFEDDGWEYVKPAGLKSVKGRVCTPGALSQKRGFLF
ncbi:hypothetical protein SCHPADRAFT_904366 [Schizopora paradoxa]|uniref:Uncharacterized protein n=1 Tax=Schizopora paradoxa TaxID=27342 RepID=A0A0H2RMW2_9AGAM|nr:hypothetical protein SCHPADRAFT_904366 [Schizopora paradoxa]